MGRSGGALKRPTQIPSTARGTCTEARTVQESLWKFCHQSHRLHQPQHQFHQSPLPIKAPTTLTVHPQTLSPSPLCPALTIPTTTILTILITSLQGLLGTSLCLRRTAPPPTSFSTPAHIPKAAKITGTLSCETEKFGIFLKDLLLMWARCVSCFCGEGKTGTFTG